MKRRTKIVALATSLLVGVSMIGVGFAAWVISNNVSETAEGNVKAESVSDKTIAFAAEVTSEKKNIVFGAEDEANDGWLTNDAVDGNLSVEITLKFETGGTLKSLTLADTYACDAEGANFQQAIDSGYIAGPTYSALSFTGVFQGKDITLENNKFKLPDGGVELTAEGTIAFTVTYSWGEKFDNNDPYTYYNTKTADAKPDGSDKTWSEIAKADLEQLETLLGGESGTSFTFTFTANAHQA